MRAADSYFECYTLFGCDAARDFDVEIGKRREKVSVVTAHRVMPFMVFGPRFVVIPCAAAERGHDPEHVMSVLATDVFLDERPLRPAAVTRHRSHGKTLPRGANVTPFGQQLRASRRTARAESPGDLQRARVRG